MSPFKIRSELPVSEPSSALPSYRRPGVTTVETPDRAQAASTASFQTNVGGTTTSGDSPNISENARTSSSTALSISAAASRAEGNREQSTHLACRPAAALPSGNQVRFETTRGSVVRSCGCNQRRRPVVLSPVQLPGENTASCTRCDRVEDRSVRRFREQANTVFLEVRSDDALAVRHGQNEPQRHDGMTSSPIGHEPKDVGDLAQRDRIRCGSGTPVIALEDQNREAEDWFTPEPDQ